MATAERPMPNGYLFWLSFSLGFIPVLESLHWRVVGIDQDYLHSNDYKHRKPSLKDYIFLRPIRASREPCRAYLAIIGLSRKQHFAWLSKFLLVRQNDSSIEKAVHDHIKDNEAAMKRISINPCLPLNIPIAFGMETGSCPHSEKKYDGLMQVADIL